MDARVVQGLDRITESLPAVPASSLIEDDDQVANRVFRQAGPRPRLESADYRDLPLLQAAECRALDRVLADHPQSVSGIGEGYSYLIAPESGDARSRQGVIRAYGRYADGDALMACLHQCVAPEARPCGYGSDGYGSVHVAFVL